MTIHKWFNKLTAITSTNAKIDHLATADTLHKLVLLSTYNPFKMYGITPKKTSIIGTLTFEESWANIVVALNNLSERTVTGNNAADMLQNLLQTLDEPGQDLLIKIINKDLRAGVSVTTINKAIPGLIPVFGVMLAKSWDGKIPSRGLYMSLKLDGLRGVYVDGKLYTRNGIEIKGMDHILDALHKLPMRQYDGELMVPGEHFQTASGLIRSSKPCPLAVFNIFDIADCPLEFTSRLGILSGLSVLLNNPCIKLVKHIPVKDHAHIITNMNKAIAAGYEGLVLKTANHLYQRKRSSDWQKLKLVESVDCKVVGFFEGEGKYTGSLGGIIVDHEGVTVRVGSGFSDTKRAEIWHNWRKFKDTTAEILYHEVTPDGSLRHPRFKTFRVDK